MKEKKCSKCCIIKDFDEFHNDKRKKDGKFSECKKCSSKVRKARLNKIKKRNKLNKINENETKVCSKCGIIKKLSAYNNNIASLDGKTTQCRDCILKYNRNRYNNYKIDNELIVHIGTKKCTICGETKDLDLFFVNKTSKDWKQSACKICKMEEHKKYVDLNKEKIVEYQKEYRIKYYKDNKEKISKRQSEYYLDEKNSASIENKKAKGRQRYLLSLGEISKRHRKYHHSPAKYKLFYDKLTIEESPIEGKGGDLMVKCSFCKKYFIPKNYQVRGRISSLKTNNLGESRLYCSDKCKNSCSIYYAKSTPREARVIAKRARCEQSTNRKALLANQIDSVGYNYCEKCGVELNSSELALHHSILVSENYKEANNMAHQIIACKKHHEEFHQSCK